MRDACIGYLRVCDTLPSRHQNRCVAFLCVCEAPAAAAGRRHADAHDQGLFALNFQSRAVCAKTVSLGVYFQRNLPGPGTTF